MENYYIESIINKAAHNIEELINQHIIIKNKKIILYGLDTFSFAMKTILSNLGFKIDSYVSDDIEATTKYKRYMKSIRARYLNSSQDLVGIFDIDERLSTFDTDVIILSSSKRCPIQKFKKLNYLENINFFQIFDWAKDNFAEFVSCKREMTLKEIQAIEKDMLLRIDTFCMARKLRYWVCGGTLLGTLRHKGFIPWDDDIDLFMPWKDYKIFIREYKGTKNYSLLTPENVDRKDYYDLWSKLVDNRTIIREDLDFLRKIHPVSIDIFPLIGMPETIRERKHFFEQYNELEKMMWEDFYSKNGDLSIYNRWYPLQKEFLKKYDFDQSNYVGVLATAYKEKDCTTKDVYKTTLRMPFEDIEVNVPIGYKEYLDNLYGKGWGELPDEDKRVSHHHMEAYWL